MNAKPFVSIIVRTYNRPDRLRECLTSLRQQDYDNFEVVIVNDAGDDVQEIIADTLDQLPSQYVCNPENYGRTAALNIGVQSVQGEYVCFLDDDDVVYPHHIRTLAEAVGPNRFPVVYSDIINVTFQQDDNTQEWKRVKEQLVYSFDFERDNFLLANYIPITCLLIRKDCFDSVGPFDESLLVYEDWEFLIRLSRKFPFKHIKNITGEYRRRDDNSNILEKDKYPINEKIVKRRYRKNRNDLFDKVFKRTFQLQRDMRTIQQQGHQWMQQAQQLQSKLIENQRQMTSLQKEILQLRQKKTNDS